MCDLSFAQFLASNIPFNPQMHLATGNSFAAAKCPRYVYSWLSVEERPLYK